MSTFTIYHNSRCSKSRQTLALLHDNGIEPEIVEYLKTPPSAAQLADVHAAVGGEVGALIRDKEPIYRDLGLQNQQLRDCDWYDLIVEHPKLLERPIVVRGDRGVIGRPPENVLELLD